MYKKPYYLQYEKCCFRCFLKRKQIVNRDKSIWQVMINYRNNKILNISDDNKTIFEIRYQKLKSYFKYAHNSKNIIFVSHDYIKDPSNCSKFLHAINKKYNLGIDENHMINEITNHSVTHVKNSKSTQYDIKIQEEERKIIERYKDDEIEDWVNNLTFEMS